MAPFSYRRAMRKTPRIALFLKQRQQQQQQSAGSRKWKAHWIILFVTIVMGIQVIFLRSVAIENQVHSGEEQSNRHDFLHQMKSPAKSTERIRSQRKLLPPNPTNTKTKLLYEELPALAEFPTWIQEYVTWHGQVRKDYPGMELFNNPNAPKLLVRTCLGLCGGLHDRIGQLPWDLYLAYKTKRVLLIAWQRPKSLENYFVPTGLLNWTIPEEAHFGFDDMRHVRNFTELFQGFPEGHPTPNFFEQDLDVALERAIDGTFSTISILRHRLLGHLGQENLEQRLENIMENPKSIHQAPLFGKVFWLFFKPSGPVHDKTKRIMNELHLNPYDYTAVHCRVRHPKAFSYGANIKGNNSDYPADKTGLPWEGETREAALGVAYKALKCATATTTGATSNQVYFLSDSNDLVRHVTQELPSSNATSNFDWTHPKLQQLVSSSSNTNTHVENKIHVIARDSWEQTAHIDRNKGRPANAYYDTFVDLLIVMHAQCVIYGIGYYAAFGAKVSGTTCRYLYQQEEWGSNGAVKEAEICPTAT